MLNPHKTNMDVRVVESFGDEWSRFDQSQLCDKDFTEIFEEDIIAEGWFGRNCFIDYVLFDDLVETDEEHLVAIFRVGRAGWQNGGKIVLLDEDDRPYTIIINRMDNVVTLEQGDIEMMWPKRKDEVWF